MAVDIAGTTGRFGYILQGVPLRSLGTYNMYQYIYFGFHAPRYVIHVGVDIHHQINNAILDWDGLL